MTDMDIYGMTYNVMYPLGYHISKCHLVHRCYYFMLSSICVLFIADQVIDASQLLQINLLTFY